MSERETKVILRPDGGAEVWTPGYWPDREWKCEIVPADRIHRATPEPDEGEREALAKAIAEKTRSRIEEAVSRPGFLQATFIAAIAVDLKDDIKAALTTRPPSEALREAREIMEQIRDIYTTEHGGALKSVHTMTGWADHWLSRYGDRLSRTNTEVDDG